ncbi:MAG: hypothetical protein QME60_04515 [Verrucomicrobiota bacterium]|nr:hypothetical protein [Verrucomicrobiota bacterium]
MRRFVAVGAWLALTVAMSATAPAPAAEVVMADSRGAIQTLLVGEKFVPIRANLYLPTPGWKNLATLNNASDAKLAAAGNRRAWSGRVEAEPGRFCRYDEVILENPGQVSLSLHSQPPSGATILTLHAVQKRYDFDGFGWNYCLGVDSPVTAYTLKNLRGVWARSEMLLRDWEPENDNASASEVKWDAFKSKDQPGSKLRRRFQLDQQLRKHGLRLAVSVWQLPNWLYADPDRPTSEHGRRLAPDKWPDLLECVASCLLHEKREYGVEPDLFSFNEPDIGVYVRFSAEEQRDLVRRAGALFQKLGLKTRLLLGDTHSPRDTHVYAQTAADDPQAARFVGALAFHSWGGAGKEQYKAWADLAAKLRTPLLVTETGVDPEARKTGVFDSFSYGLREARMVQELLLCARTSETESFAELPVVTVKKGSQELSLAARSLLTLTTLPK